MRAALLLVAPLPILTHATEGALGRTIAGTGIQRNGGIALTLGVQVSVTSGTVIKAWGAEPGRLSFASSVTVPYLWNEVTPDFRAPVGSLNRQESESGIFDSINTKRTADGSEICPNRSL